MESSAQERATNEQEQRETVPVRIVQRHCVLTVTVVYITDIQDLTYADGTEEQIGNARVELRVSLDRDISVDDYTHHNPREEPVQLPCSGRGSTIIRSQSC